MQALICLGAFWGGIAVGFVLCTIIMAGKDDRDVEAQALHASNQAQRKAAAAAWRDE